jgi:hypothetical protein
MLMAPRPAAAALAWTTWAGYDNNAPYFSGPSGVAADAAGNVYVVDTGHDVIQGRSSDGAWTTSQVGRWSLSR